MKLFADNHEKGRRRSAFPLALAALLTSEAYAVDPAICLKIQTKGRAVSNNSYIARKGKCRKGYVALAPIDPDLLALGRIPGDKGPTGLAGAAGPQGERGSVGEQGPTGAQGIQGLRGEMGPMGPQGPQGEMGPAGVKGDKGDKGDTGNTGPNGPKGDPGASGPQGSKGDKGDTGPQGMQGVEGPAGTLSFTQCTNKTLVTEEKSGSQSLTVMCADPAGSFMLTYSWATTDDVKLRDSRVSFGSGSGIYPYPVGITIGTNNQGSVRYTLSVTAICCPFQTQQ